jgi:hypothetical protein
MKFAVGSRPTENTKHKSLLTSYHLYITIIPISMSPSLLPTSDAPFRWDAERSMLLASFI